MIRRFSKGIILLSALGVLFAVLFLINRQIQAQINRPMSAAMESQTPYPSVSVATVSAAAYDAEVTGYGAATPRFQLTLTAEVAGRVTAIQPGFESGRRVRKGDVLARLEQSDYQSAVASAQNSLSQARLALLEEERKGAQAKAEWEASGAGGEPDSDLVLRKPQLAAAQAAVVYAEAALAVARKDLQYTSIRAPFDALIVARQVAPGSYLTAGGEVATLYSTDRMEIAVSLSSQQWDKLPDLQQLVGSGQPVGLVHIQTGREWTGRMLRSEQHLDETTRQRKLIVAVDRPLDQTPPLLPGTFVKAVINGRRLNQLWRLPGSALSQKGEIWYLTEENRLKSFAAAPRFSDEETIYVAVPDSLAMTDQKVLVHPLSGYIEGMTVVPVEEESHVN